MKQWWKRFRAELPWSGDSLLCGALLTLCALGLYVGLSSAETDWKLIIGSSLGLFIIAVYSVFLIRDMYQWARLRMVDLTPEVCSLSFTAEQLRSRFQQMEQMVAEIEDCTLLPSQIRRIAQESSVKLPARFLSNEYVNG